MTVQELLAHKKTTYLFAQRGWKFYACGNKFYKAFQDVVLPAERRDINGNS